MNLAIFTIAVSAVFASPAYGSTQCVRLEGQLMCSREPLSSGERIVMMEEDRSDFVRQKRSPIFSIPSDLDLDGDDVMAVARIKPNDSSPISLFGCESEFSRIEPAIYVTHACGVTSFLGVKKCWRTTRIVIPLEYVAEDENPDNVKPFQLSTIDLTGTHNGDIESCVDHWEGTPTLDDFE